MVEFYGMTASYFAANASCKTYGWASVDCLKPLNLITTFH